MSAAFKKLAETLGVFDLWSETRSNSLPESDQWAHHAVQAVAWDATGCSALRSVQEDVVISFTEAGTGDNNRITCLMNKAFSVQCLPVSVVSNLTPFQMARNGLYEQSLCLLLDSDTWRGLILADYDDWAHTLWRILLLRATRRSVGFFPHLCLEALLRYTVDRGQHRVYREQLVPRRGPGPYNPRHYFSDPRATVSRPDKLHDTMYDIINTRVCIQFPCVHGKRSELCS